MSLRSLVLGTAAALALVVFSANVNQAAAQSQHGNEAQFGELGLNNKGIDYMAGASDGFVFYQFIANVLINPIADCERRRKGIPGANLGPQASQPSLMDIFFNDGRVDADQAAYKKTPAALAPCSMATVASKAELQRDRFAQFGIDTSKAAFTASATDLGAQQRALMVAQFSTAMTEQYASAAR